MGVGKISLVLAKEVVNLVGQQLSHFIRDLLNISRISTEKRAKEERRTLGEIVGLRRGNRRGRVSRSRRARTARK